MDTNIDTILMTVPVSSPLHPQVILPFLKGFLNEHGFKAKIIDTNIGFFKWMLHGNKFDIKNNENLENPIKMLSLYNEIEKTLSYRCRAYQKLQLGLRNITMKYNKLEFESVLSAIEDLSANPFMKFYENFVNEQLIEINPKIIGISITFQDQIIAAFTLANAIRQQIPLAKIILGGQIITRCYDTMLENNVLNHLWDYLTLWEGELPLLDIHKKVLYNCSEPMCNVIDKGNDTEIISRSLHAFDLNNLSQPDFSDFDLTEYLFPEIIIPLQTARGCYGSCEFCAIPAGSNNSFRQRTIENIITDILNVQQHILEKYGKKAIYFKFMDDTTSHKTLFELSKEIENRGIDAKWETFVRFEKQFEAIEFMKQLYRGGCRKLMWGLESNDPEVLKNMNKKTTPISMTKVLNTASNAGILNFVFVLVGFPGETAEQRNKLVEYIIQNENIHVLTIATFDLTKHSPIQKNFVFPNKWNLEYDKAKGFEVRLPYMINGKNWKKMIVDEAQKMLLKIIEARPDIGFMSLFPDQTRGILCNKYGNTWGRKFLSNFGEENIKKLWLSTENYVTKYDESDEIDFSSVIPEPLLREHSRTKEDIEAIAKAIAMRKKYENRRIDQV